MALSSKQTEHATVAIYTGGGRNSISIARRRHHNNNSSPDDYNIFLFLYYSQLLSYLRTQFSGPDELMYSIQFYYFPTLFISFRPRIIFHSSVCNTQFLRCKFVTFSIRVVVHLNLTIILYFYYNIPISTRTRSRLVLLYGVGVGGRNVSSELATNITQTNHH